MKKTGKMIFVLAVYFLLLLNCPTLYADQQVKKPEKLTVVLDWFVNPNHAPLIIAQQQGYFRDEGLDVQFITPANPSDPPKWVAAGKADIAVDYQPQFMLEVAQGLPLVQVGSLISRPLNCLAVLADGPIHSIKDLKGKLIASSTGGIDSVMLKAMLEKNGLKLTDVHIVSVGYGLTVALLSKKADAAMGFMRNFEPIELKLAGHPVRLFYPEENGFPPYDELIFITHGNKKNDPRITRFFVALQRGVNYLQAHQQDSWQQFVKAHPELNNNLNKESWFATLPYFSKQPAKLNIAQCKNLADYLRKNMSVNIPQTVC